MKMMNLNEGMNILNERTDIAKALNFGKYKVLTYDMDEGKGAKAVVLEKTRNHGTLRRECTLYCGKIKEDDGIFYLLTRATMLSAHVSVYDYLENAERANAPIIEEGDEVAVLCYSKALNLAFVRLIKAGRITPEYSTAAAFTDLEK